MGGFDTYYVANFEDTSCVIGEACTIIDSIIIQCNM